MKKLLSILLLVSVIVTMISCTGNEKGEEKADTPNTVRVFTLKGPTGMGMGPLMSNSEKGNTELQYDFTVASGADEFTGEIIRGEFEIAAVPTNLAAVLYQKTEKKIKIAAVNTLGVLYVLENGDTVNSVYDLEGKTIYSSGLGAVPEFATSYILDTLGIKCDVKYESDHDTVVADIITGKADIAILPEPKVTAALMNSEKPKDLRIALNMGDLWDEANMKNGNEGTLSMGCIIVNSEWAQKCREECETFLKEYKESIDFTNSNHKEAAGMIAENEIIPKAKMAEAAIESSNIVFVDGDTMIKNLDNFFNILYSFDKKSVGGILPDENIYLK